MSPKDVSCWLQEQGYKAKLEERADGSSIESGLSGIPFHIFFGRFDPETEQLDEFDDFNFLAGGDIDGDPNLAALNQRNATDKYLRAYYEDGTLWFQMDAPIGSEHLTPELFGLFFETWIDWLPDAIRGSTD